MGLPQEVRMNFNALVNSGNVRYQVWPDAAAGAAVVNVAGAPENVAWVWSQTATSQVVIAVTTIPDPCWLLGIQVLTCSWAAATTYGDIQICSGGVGAETWLAILPIAATVTAAMAMPNPIWLPFPIRLAGRPALGARIRNNTGAIATGVVIKAITASAVGT